MVLSDSDTVLYVGYYFAQCVVAYDVATLQLMWRADFLSEIESLSFYNGMVLVAPRDVPFTILSAADGSVVRTLDVVDGTALGISVFAGTLSR